MLTPIYLIVADIAADFGMRPEEIRADFKKFIALLVFAEPNGRIPPSVHLPCEADGLAFAFGLPLRFPSAAPLPTPLADVRRPTADSREGGHFSVTESPLL